MAQRIEDYAFIGDRGTAVVGRDGSIHWLQRVKKTYRKPRSLLRKKG